MVNKVTGSQWLGWEELLGLSVKGLKMEERRRGATMPGEDGGDTVPERVRVKELNCHLGAEWPNRAACLGSGQQRRSIDFSR